MFYYVIKALNKWLQLILGTRLSPRSSKLIENKTSINVELNFFR